MDQEMASKNTSSNSKASRDAAKYNLRTKSIQNRIEVERRKNEPRHPKPKQRPAPLSKYRRRTANFRERCRMQEMNDAFKRLQSVVPGDETSESKQNHSTTMSAAAASKATKIHTLKLAVNYISALTAMLNQSEHHHHHQHAQLQSPHTSTTASHHFNIGNHGNNNHINTLNHMNVNLMGNKSKACQTMERTVNGNCSIRSSTCVASQTDLGSGHTHSSDLNVGLTHLHLHQLPPQQSYYGGLPLEALNSSYKQVSPLLSNSAKESLNCEISHQYYGYSQSSHHSMSHHSNDISPSDSLFLASANSSLISSSPFDLGSSSTCTFNASAQVDTLLEADFSAIIEDLQGEEGFVDGLID